MAWNYHFIITLGTKIKKWKRLKCKEYRCTECGFLQGVCTLYKKAYFSAYTSLYMHIAMYAKQQNQCKYMQLKREHILKLALHSLSMSVLWQPLIVHRDFFSHLEVKINCSFLSKLTFWLMALQWILSSKKPMCYIPFLGDKRFHKNLMK